jgi:hypothetical protein
MEWLRRYERFWSDRLTLYVETKEAEARRVGK